MLIIISHHTGGEDGIRTHEKACASYTLSRRTPSTTRTPLQQNTLYHFLECRAMMARLILFIPESFNCFAAALTVEPVV